MKKQDFLIKLKEQGKIELVEPSINITESYSQKSDNCLKSAQILFEARLYENSVAEAYYSMYDISLALLFRCGIKCENHTGTILLLKDVFYFIDESKMLSTAKKERIDKQYYTTEKSEPVNKESAMQMIKEAEQYNLLLKEKIDKIPKEINLVKKRFEEI